MGAPYRALVAAARRMLGEHAHLIVPAGAARLLQETDHEVYDWYDFLRMLTGIAFTPQPTPEMVALLGTLCEQHLTPHHYFGKVRTSPAFHAALAQSFCRWTLDGLTPDLLQRGATRVIAEYATLAALTEPELQHEWQQKTAELALLWREWQAVLQNAGLPEPQHTLQRLSEALAQLNQRLPPVLLAGFTELTVQEVRLLRLLASKTQVGIAVPYDPERTELYTPIQKLLQLLQDYELSVDTHLMGKLALFVEAADVPSITILDTPNPLAEVETVAREILRLRSEGIEWGEIALLVRQPESLWETLEVIFARYGIPLQGEVSLPLLRSWRVHWLMTGLRLLSGVGEGEDWLVWLGHPAHGLSYEALRALRKNVRRHLPATAWLDVALQRASAQETQTLLQHLRELRTLLPAELPRVARALALLLIRNDTPHPHETDLSTWRQLIDAYADEWRRRTALHAIELLERLVRNARYRYSVPGQGVRVLPMEYADLVGARVAFALNVLEGVLPRRHPDDPFLREAERLALNRALADHRVRLPTRSDYQAGEPMLFQRVLSAAAQHLYLSYPRTQDEESDAFPSFYIEALKAERGAAIEVRFFGLEQVAPDHALALHPYDRSLCQPPAYIEPQPLLRNPRLQARLTTLNRPFSTTELETLTCCPFQHFARYILRLRPLQSGLTLMDVGNFAHATLCRAVRRRPASQNAQAWIEVLVSQLTALLEEDRPDLPEWQVQVLHALVQRLVRRFGWREPRYQEAFELIPFACEWAFGTPALDDEERTRTEPLHNRTPPRAISYPLSNGQAIQIAGVIDRIDLSPDRRIALVIDYKLGGVPERRDLTAGRVVQGMLYLHAVRTLLPNASVVLAYDHLKAAKRVRFVPNLTELVQRFRILDWEDRETRVILGLQQWHQAEQATRQRITEAVVRLRRADITPTPGEQCKRCVFSDFCRMAQR
ncbi:MAG: PD-(D/E)XK nuclease family protein [Fimbriimonadales bacterium]|nr:PD-(D/E)XK nuclease family protein [Fimbriimonadales bacterium]